MKYISVASGSSGNCHYVEKNNTRIIVDIGLSGKAAEEGLRFNDANLSSVNAIFITHEHIDHIKGIGIVSRRYDIPVFATEDTWNAIGSSIGKMKDKNKLLLDKHKSLSIGDLNIRPFATSHDAADSCGFIFDDGCSRLAIATDLGCITESVEQAVMSCDVVVLESNHDVEMLKVGSYPYHLKRRVLSQWGHLSNDTAAELSAKLVLSGTKAILLAHLSGENNLPLLAYETVSSVLESHHIIANKDVRLSILERGRPSGIFDLKKI